MRETKTYNRLNASAVNAAFRDHVLAIAKSSAENYGKKVETLEEAKSFIVNTFMKEYSFQVDQLRGYRSNQSLQNIFIEWLQGLSLNVLYTNYDIENFLKSLKLKYNNQGKETETAAYIYFYKIFKVVSDELMEAL